MPNNRLHIPISFVFQRTPLFFCALAHGKSKATSARGNLILFLCRFEPEFARFNLLSFLETPIHRSESADCERSGRTHLPSIHEGEKPMFFPPRGSPFSFRNRRSSLPPLVGPAAGRRTKARPKRLNGLFYLPGFILGCSMGQIRRMGGRKTRQKRQTYSIRWFY